MPLIEFSIRSIDSGVHNREEIRHYDVAQDKIRRIDPVALSPRDFVDEWMTRDWKESAHWSESATRAHMRGWHAGPRGVAEFIGSTLHCTTTPDIWQVGVAFGESPNKNTYFRVRWQPPYRFSMVDIRDQPTTDCIEEDRVADERRTLFPPHQ